MIRLDSAQLLQQELLPVSGRVDARVSSRYFCWTFPNNPSRFLRDGSINNNDYTSHYCLTILAIDPLEVKIREECADSRIEGEVE